MSANITQTGTSDSVNFKKFYNLNSARNKKEFPIHCLPYAVQNYVNAVSESIQVYPDMPAALSLAVLALTIQKKAKIAFDATWSEELNLYLCIFADPAERKSPVYNAMMSPVQQYIDEYNTKYASQIQSYHETKAALEAKKSTLIQKGKTEELEKINEEINDLVPMNYMKLTTSDITAEALAEKMYYNNGCMGVMSDEGGIFDIAAGLYSSGININIYLKSYDGQIIIIDRKNGSLCIHRPLLTFGICAQPCILSNLLNNEAFMGRGFIQRFLFCVPPSMVGKRTLSSDREHKFLETREEYKELIYKLLSLPMSEAKLTLTEEAKEKFNDFYDRIEAGLAKGGYLEDNRDYFGKFAGRTLRIAGILHMAEYQDLTRAVDADTVQKAITIAEYFMMHSLNIFDEEQNLSVAETVFNKMANKCIANSVSRISYRDTRRAVSKKITNKMLDEAIEILIDHGYIAEVSMVQTQFNGRKKPEYEIHPVLLKRLAHD